jgi:predicted nucleotidyltransferase
VTREEVQSRLSEKRTELDALGVRGLQLFGSVARGEAGPSSDVDLLIDFEAPVGLFHFVRVQQRLEEILGCRVDLVMRESLRPQLRDRIFAEAVRAA